MLQVDEIGIFELPAVDSVLLDSCDYSITVIDENFAEARFFFYENCFVKFLEASRPFP